MEVLLIVFIGITAMAVLLQAFVLLGMLLTVRKAVKLGEQQANEYRSKVGPILDGAKELMTVAKDTLETGKSVVTDTKGLIAKLQPALTTAATELSDMARDIHQQANDLQTSLDEVAHKARVQADRVDTMTTSVLNGVDRVGSFVNQMVQMPIRQVNGLVAAAKAVVETLRRTPQPPRAPQPAQVAEDKDLFV